MFGSNLNKVFPAPPPICNWTMSEFAEHVCTVQDLRDVVEANLDALRDQIGKAFQIPELKPFAGSADVVLRDILGSEDLMSMSQEGLDTFFKNALISIKNFFLNLWASVVAFFKRIFDANSKTKTTLFNQLREFDKQRSITSDEKIKNLKVFLPNSPDAVRIISDLGVLFRDASDLSKVPNITDVANYKTGLGLFGYTVKNGVVYDDHKRDISANTITFGDHWTIDELRSVTNQMIQLCTDAANLNVVKNSLENDVSVATRTIDKYITLGDNAKAQELQYELNNKSLRSSYVFKCAVVFQSYVTQLSGMLIDVWTNILAVK